eukprot:CAMPEP_0195110688 /NCGR_PEP_ID=MMETSP0448-20130528/93629_1 /TAXON_ID=66468 /ORGANISM="Heterocapsa triquestra, Strain CCMP 448" /LENGTH=382 /DNA_ID=CAMNT_0040147411 /DNA_START=1 /DNA_END=1145 /DNA_ORIENTATION=+
MSDGQDAERPSKRGRWSDEPPLNLAEQTDLPEWLKDLANAELATNKSVPAAIPPGMAALQGPGMGAAPAMPMPPMQRAGQPIIQGQVGGPPIDIGGGIQLTIAGSQVGTIIGKGGEVINKIRQESGADVKVQHQEGDQTATVTIKGSPQGIQHAHTAVKDRLAAYQGGGGGSNLPRDNSSWETKIHECPKDLVALVIGSGGTNLKEMEEKSGCRVNFVKANEIDPNAEIGKQVCRIRGMPDKIGFAEQLYYEKIQEVQSYRDRRQQGKGCGKNWGDPHVNPNEPKIFVKLRGMPYNVSKQDIIGFLQPYIVSEDMILFGLADGWPSGEAWVNFGNDKTVQEVILQKNKQQMGHRYIELFASTQGELSRFGNQSSGKGGCGMG